MVDGPDQLPENVLRVNGFRHVRSNEYYVEWRRRDGETTEVWLEYESTPHTGSGWFAQYHVKDRRGNNYKDQGTIGKFRPEEFEAALAAAVKFMRSGGAGSSGSSGGDFDFTGGL